MLRLPGHLCPSPVRSWSQEVMEREKQVKKNPSRTSSDTRNQLGTWE